MGLVDDVHGSSFPGVPLLSGAQEICFAAVADDLVAARFQGAVRGRIPSTPAVVGHGKSQTVDHGTTNSVLVDVSREMSCYLALVRETNDWVRAAVGRGMIHSESDSNRRVCHPENDSTLGQADRGRIRS